MEFGLDNVFLITVSLDLSKAFDIIDPIILSKNLEYYGFRCVINEWFKSHLTNITQFVYIDGCRSSKITHFIRSSAVFHTGPLLFLLYINDMHYATNLHGSTAFIRGDCISDLTNFFNDKLCKVFKCFCAN